jgi:hypothetical protein
MDNQTQNMVLWAAIGFLILGLFAIVWWGMRAYLADLRAREVSKQAAQDARDAKLELRDEKLKSCIDGLKESIWGLRDLYVLRKEYDKDMANLQRAAGHVVGRRMGEVMCPHPDCPLAPEDPRGTWPEGTRLPMPKVD